MKFRLGKMLRSRGGMQLLFLATGFLVLSVGFLGFWMLTQNKPPTDVVESQVQVSAPQNKPFFLTVESPNEDKVAVDNKVVVRGRTLPNTTVVFYTETDQDSVGSDNQGNFSGTISLNEGINSLTVLAVSEDGEEKDATMDIIYNPS